MSQDLSTQDYIQHQIKQLNVTDLAIEELNNKYGELTIKDFSDVDGYKIVKAARTHVKELRVNLEKKRKELVENPMRIKKEIDSEAKRRKEQLELLENKLSVQENAFEAEKDRIKKEKAAEIEKKYQARLYMIMELGFKFSDDKFTLHNQYNATEFHISNECLRTGDEVYLSNLYIKAKGFYDEIAAKNKEIADQKAETEDRARLEHELKLREQQEQLAIEQERIKQERIEKQKEFDKLEQERNELIEQKREFRHAMLINMGISYNVLRGSYTADWFNGDVLERRNFEKLSDAEFLAVVRNYTNAKISYEEMQKSLPEVRLTIDTEIEYKPEFENVVKLPSDDLARHLQERQSIIKAQCGFILELYGITIPEITLNINAYSWNIEHNGYRLFTCTIAEYINSIGERDDIFN